MNPSKRDLYWVIAFATLILVGVITFWLGGKGNEMVSYIGFAGTLISIILAVVAIFYSIVQGVSSQQNIGEMKTLVSEASRIMTEKAESMESLLRAQQESVKLTSSPPESRPTVEVKVSFSLSYASHLTRFFAYFLLRSYTAERLLPVEQFVSITKPLVKMTETQLSSYAFGTLHAFACCFAEYLEVEDQTKVRLKGLPDNFETHVLAMAQRMKKTDPALGDTLRKIDDIAGASGEQGNPVSDLTA